MPSYDLDKKLDEYSEELFVDLGLTGLPEEQKADIYARLEERLHHVILNTLTPALSGAEVSKLKLALEQEDYRGLSKILKKHPQFKTELEEKIQKEFDQLKLTLAEEQKHAGEKPGGTVSRA